MCSREATSARPAEGHLASRGARSRYVLRVLYACSILFADVPSAQAWQLAEPPAPASERSGGEFDGAPSEARPFLVVAVARPEQLQADLRWLGELAGSQTLPATVHRVLAKRTGLRSLAGFDRARPAGLVLMRGDYSISGLLLLPIDDLDTMLESLAPLMGEAVRSTQAGEPESTADVEAGTPQAPSADSSPPGDIQLGRGALTALLRQQGDWAYLAQSERSLAAMPDPAWVEPWRGHDFSVRLILKNFPEVLRDFVLDKALVGLEEAQQRRGDESAEQYAIRLLEAQSLFRLTEILLREVAEIDLGVSIDRETSTIRLETRLLPLPQTELDHLLAQFGESADSGGRRRDEEANESSIASQRARRRPWLRITLPLPSSWVELERVTMFPAYRHDLAEAARRHAEANAAEELERARLLAFLVDVADAMLATGRVDAAIDLHGERPPWTLTARVATDAGIELAGPLTRLAQQLDGGAHLRSAEASAVKLDARDGGTIDATHAKFVLHHDARPQAARAVLGDRLRIHVLATRGQFVVASGPDAEALVQAVATRPLSEAPGVPDAPDEDGAAFEAEADSAEFLAGSDAQTLLHARVPSLDLMRAAEQLEENAARRAVLGLLKGNLRGAENEIELNVAYTAPGAAARLTLHPDVVRALATWLNVFGNLLAPQ